jgi:hypothetical protein
MEGFMRGSAVAAIMVSGLLALPVALHADDIDPPQKSPVSEVTANAGANAEAQDTLKTVLPKEDVQGVLGKEVKSSTGEDLGRIVEVLVDQLGQVRAAVIDFGGFLGVGSRKVVVDWATMHFVPADARGQITLDLTRDQIKAAPEYRDGKPVVVVGTLAPALPDM